MTNISFEKFLLDLLSNLGETNFDVAINVVLILFGIFWLVVVGWVWNDSGERTTRIIYRILSVLLVLIFNIPGLVIYLIMRPNTTIEELYWADLERRYLKYETADLGDCPKCGRQLQAGFVMCPFCGEKIKEKCEKCGNYLEKDWTICPFCGNPRLLTSKDEDISEKSVREIKKSREGFLKLLKRKREQEMAEKSVRKVSKQENSIETSPATNSEDILEEKSENSTEANEPLTTPEVTEIPTADPEVLTTEQMQEEIAETKEEIVESSKERKTKYAKHKGLFSAILGAFRSMKKPKSQEVVVSSETTEDSSDAIITSTGGNPVKKSKKPQNKKKNKKGKKKSKANRKKNKKK